MKKILFVLLLMLLPMSVYAYGGITPSTTNLSIGKGGSASFTITASNAVGRVDVFSNNAAIATVNTSSAWLENNSIVVTVVGVGAGSTTITVNLSDAATFDEEELTGSYSINVTVTEPQPVVPSQPQVPSTPSIPSGGGSTNNDSTNNNNLSKDNSIAKLEVEGFKLTENNGVYSLTVNNDVTSINIIGKPTDDKASITGTGKKDIIIGENKFEVIVTSEYGEAKSYNIVVIRKNDKFEFKDAKNEIANGENNITIIVNETDNVITKDLLSMIKDTKKTIKFNSYDSDGKVLYSWIIDGNKLKSTNEFKTLLTFETKNKNEIDKISNYANGIYLNFAHEGKLPEGTIVRIYVANKYSDGEVVKLYNYDKENSILKNIKNEIKVKDGYIEFELEHCSEYFVTKSNVETKSNVYMLISLIELIIIIGLIISLVIITIKNKKKYKKGE